MDKTPLVRHLRTHWSVGGITDRTVTCSTYEVATGRELRVERGDELMRSELFRGGNADVQGAEVARHWHDVLIAQGWTDV